MYKNEDPYNQQLVCTFSKKDDELARDLGVKVKLSEPIVEEKPTLNTFDRIPEDERISGVTSS